MDEESRLIELAGSGSTVEDCAAALGRPVGATKVRIGRLRGAGKLPPLFESWTETADVTLTEAYATELPVREISRTVQRPPHQVHTRVAALRREGADLPPRKPRWTDAERERLAKLRRQGASLRELEREFGKTRGTITSQLRTLRRLGYDLTGETDA